MAGTCFKVLQRRPINNIGMKRGESMLNLRRVLERKIRGLTLEREAGRSMGCLGLQSCLKLEPLSAQYCYSRQRARAGIAVELALKI
jgi:hypothetical protein